MAPILDSNIMTNGLSLTGRLGILECTKLVFLIQKNVPKFLQKMKQNFGSLKYASLYLKTVVFRDKSGLERFDYGWREKKAQKNWFQQFKFAGYTSLKITLMGICIGVCQFCNIIIDVSKVFLYVIAIRKENCLWFMKRYFQGGSYYSTKKNLILVIARK